MILTKARALVFYAKLRYFCVGGHCCCCRRCSCSISMYVYVMYMLRLCVCVRIPAGHLHIMCFLAFAHVFYVPWLLRCYLWHLTP